jgi:hypothetical protein
MAKGKKTKRGTAARTAKRKKRVVKSKRKVKAPAKKRTTGPGAKVMAGLREEIKQWQQLHSQLQEHVRAKDTTISKQMLEIMELRKRVEELRARMQP